VSEAGQPRAAPELPEVLLAQHLSLRQGCTALSVPVAVRQADPRQPVLARLRRRARHDWRRHVPPGMPAPDV